MKKTLLILLFFVILIAPARATIYNDGYLSLATQTTGATASGTVLANGSVPSGAISWSITGSGSSLTVAAHGIDDSHLTMVRGVNQPTIQGEKCLALNTAGGQAFAQTQSLPAGIKKINVNLWFKPGMSPGSGNVFYDLIMMQAGNNVATYFQIRASTASDINIETAPPTQHTADIRLVNGNWYFMNCMVDTTAGTANLWIYDVNNSLVGHVTSTTFGAAGTDINKIRIGNAEFGNGSGTTYFQSVGWDYTYGTNVYRPNRGLNYPPERQADWNNAGFTVPQVTTVFQTLAAGSSPATVKSAMGSCPANQVVVLAAGTYNWATALDISSGPLNRVLRGTKSNGTNGTIINWDATRGIRLVNETDTAGNTEVTVTSNIRKGESTIRVAAVPTWCKVGYTLGIDQLNDEVLSSVTTCRESAQIYRNNGDLGLSNGDRGQGELVRIAAVTSTTITTVHPILHDFTTVRTAQIFMPGYDMAASTPIQQVGIEDITMVGATAGDSQSPARCFSLYNTVNCWFTGISSIKSRSIHFFTASSYGNVYRSNYLYDAWIYNNNGQAYAFTFYGLSTRNLVENNIVKHCNANVQFNYGSSGNVASYNAFLDAHSETSDGPEISIHGNSADYNLFEGNYGDGKARFDCVHGSSYGNTLFRNRMAGKVDSEINATYGADIWQNGQLSNPNNQIACDIDYWNHDATILGNVFGTTGYHTVRYVQAPTSGSEPSPKTVYKMGYCNAFGYVQDCGHPNTGGTGNDPAVRLNMLWHNNWDAVTAGVVYDASIIDHTLVNSLYLSAKPSWFGDRPWPFCSPGSPATAVISNLPSGYRYVYGVGVPAGGGPTDTTLPDITITAPTSAGSITVLSSNVVFGGIAADNVAVATVTGALTGATVGALTISGLTTFSASTNILPGTTTATFTATDTSGNTKVDTLLITYAPPVDTTPPNNVNILVPTSSSSFATASSTVTLSGSCADNIAVVAVYWVNVAGGSGTCTLAGNGLSWSQTAIPLFVGPNVINISAYDAAGNYTSDAITVTYTPLTSPSNVSNPSRVIMRLLTPP